MKASHFKTLINFWPPYLFAGIKCEKIATDYSYTLVSMRLYWFNRNYVGTHFGGSLFSMTDPWYMLMLMPLLGKDYIVWDKKSTIDFIKPGKGRVQAEFHLPPTLVEDIRQKAAVSKYLPEFVVDIKDEQGEVVARVNKTLYVKKKQVQERPSN